MWKKKLEINLMWLPCRYHILEIILETVLSRVLSTSSGPDICLCKELKKSWSAIKQEEKSDSAISQ